MVNKFIWILALSLSLTGCEAFQAGKSVALDKGKEFADEQLDIAIEVVCYGATIGALRRRYNDDFTKWKNFCTEEITAP